MTLQSLPRIAFSAALSAALASCATQAYAQSAVRPAAAEQSRPVLKVGRANAIRIDGQLSDAAWLTTDSIADLTQIEPEEGGKPSGTTVVRVLATADALIIGIRADCPDPASITAFARQRDASLENEDHVRIVLDTYLDGRSGYVFMVNPNGSRYDALVTNQGESQNSDWDALWEAATTRTPTGWSAEILIPAKSLLFKRDLTQWGFNVQRRIQRLQESARWASPRRDVKINMTSRAGVLADLPAFDLGVGLTVRPSITASAGMTGIDAPTRTERDLSLDVTQRIGANSQASLTWRTDFAETEVDTRRTNLTRFPLSFPEKRTFFLQGADVFDFGLGTGEEVRSVFSRRIGLIGGTEVPIDAGLKVNGREGALQFGALAVRTGAAGATTSATTMGVVRLRRDVLRESSVGLIAEFGDPLARSGSWTAGTDFAYQSTRFLGGKNFLAGVWGLATDREGLAGERVAFGGKLDYPNDLLDVALTAKRIGDGFDPSLGFVPRRGVRIFSLNINFQPRPKHRILGLRVRQMFNESLNTLVTDLDGQWETYRIFTAPVNWRLESGDRFEFNYVPTGERLTAPFEIARGVVIPAGTYGWTRWRLEGGLASKRKLSGQLTWWFGDFYTGSLDELTLTANWKPSPLVIVEFNATRNSGRLAEGRFTQQVVGTRLRINVSPDLQVNSYLQYDEQTRLLGTNTRLRWTFSPQGELFVVYNHNVNDLAAQLDRQRTWQFASNQLLVKLQYAWRY